jgi:hypothetical protein
MRQIAVLEWKAITPGEMPEDEGTYLVAFSDGTVESFPMDTDDLLTGQIRAGAAKGEYWANPIPHPNA